MAEKVRKTKDFQCFLEAKKHMLETSLAAEREKKLGRRWPLRGGDRHDCGQ